MKTLTFAPTQRSLHLAAKYGYDEWIINRFLHFVPNVERMIETMREPVRRYVRTNTLKITSDELVTRLVSKGFELTETVLADVFEINPTDARVSIGATTEYLLGYYYIQDITSCIAVEALDIQPNQTVLDMASAPGGKTTFMAQKMNNTGSIIAMEIHPRRLRSLLFNIARCGVMNTLIYKMNAIQCPSLDIGYDRILLDAPCSGEGLMWKDASKRTSRVPGIISECSLVQKKLFDSALHVLKPGGLILYSTCSFAPEENEYIVNSILKRFDVEVEPISFGIEGLTSFDKKVFDERLRRTARFYPHTHNSTGFYIAKLRKKN